MQVQMDRNSSSSSQQQNNQVVHVQQGNQQLSANMNQRPSVQNENHIAPVFPSGQLLSSNFQYQQTLQQIYLLEQDCLNRCNKWFQENNVQYKITHEQVRFSTMLELEVFIIQTRNRIKQTTVNCFKYGSIFGISLSTLFFYLNSDKSFTGENIFRINTLSAVGGGIFSFLLSKQKRIADIISNIDVRIDFEKFELFFESLQQDIYKLRKKLIQ